MGRIRTIKPEFFKHEEIFEAELATGLPLRLAYIGLWLQCDREGRFVWRPRSLKLDILPYDEVDFSAVLDALAKFGFIRRYEVDGNALGVIPSFLRHQVPNFRERVSKLPSPPTDTTNALGTREAHVTHASCGEGKGKEPHNTDDVTMTILLEEDGRPSPLGADTRHTGSFEVFWSTYPSTVGQSKVEAFREWCALTADQQASAYRSLPAYTELLAANPSRAVKHVSGFLRGLMFETFESSPRSAVDWTERLQFARKNRQWPEHQWGPAPGADGCLIATELLLDGDGKGWTVIRS